MLERSNSVANFKFYELAFHRSHDFKNAQTVRGVVTSRTLVHEAENRFCPMISRHFTCLTKTVTSSLGFASTESPCAESASSFFLLFFPESA